MSRLTLALAAALAATALPAFAQTSTTTGRTMPACSPGDAVVWENTKTKAYHLQGDTYYGTTKHGKYACKSAADSAGYHAAGTKTATSHSPLKPSSAMTNGSQTSAPETAGSAAPAPEASGSGTMKSAKHHRHHHSMASPGPMTASPVPAATQ